MSLEHIFIRQCIYILCNSLFNNQMMLSFNINTLPGYIFIARPNLRVSDRQRKHAVITGFYVQGVLSYMNERDTSFLDCKHKRMLQKTELHLTNLVSCTIWYTYKSPWFQKHNRCFRVVTFWFLILTQFL